MKLATSRKSGTFWTWCIERLTECSTWREVTDHSHSIATKVLEVSLWYQLFFETLLISHGPTSEFQSQGSVQSHIRSQVLKTSWFTFYAFPAAKGISHVLKCFAMCKKKKHWNVLNSFNLFTETKFYMRGSHARNFHIYLCFFYFLQLFILHYCCQR